MRRLFSVLLVTALATMTLLGLCSIAMAEGKSGGTLVITVENTPSNLNPAVQSGTNTGVPGTQIFASPLRYDENWNPQPYLAETWEISPDGKSVTLHLVKNATFHDGQPITSEDVAFSVMTVKANHPFSTMFAPVEKVETPDAYTAIIRMSTPHPAILLSMSPPLLPIIPKHIYGDGQEPKTHPMNNKPIGSGPFKFVEFKEGEHIVLEKNKDFFIKDRPYLDKIVFKIIKDPANRIMALERGEADMQPFVTNLRDLNRLKNTSHLDITPNGYSAIGPINWLAFNTLKEPLNNKTVRQAISFAIDREFITQKLHAGLSSVATGPIDPNSSFYSKDVEHYKVDLDKANRMLDEAGYAKGANGYRFKLVCDYMPEVPECNKMMAEYLKSQLKKVGIEVEVRSSPDFPTWSQRISNYDFDMTMDQVFNWGDPVIGVHRTYLSSNIKKGVIWSNTQNYNNPRVDELLALAAKEPDMAKRKTLYAEFQKLVVDDAPQAFINVMPYHTVYNKKLQNVVTSCWGLMSPLDMLYWSSPK